MVAKRQTIAFLKAVLRGDLGQVYLASSDPRVTSSLAFRIVERLTDKRYGSKYRARVVNCPPPHLLWIIRQRAPTSAQFIHRAYCRALWRERKFAARLGLAAWYLAWPPIFALASIWATALNGRAIALRTDKPVVRQMAEQLFAAWRFGCLPQWYYTFELFDERRLRRGQEYLHRFEVKGGIYRLMLPPKGPEKAWSLNDKSQFTEWCKVNSLPVPAVHFIYRPSSPLEVLKLPPSDLFIKPVKESGGTGAEAWLFETPGHYRSLQDGTWLSEIQLLERIRSRAQDVIVQPRLVNHEGIRNLSNGALLTVRVLTFLNETGSYEATHAGLRMAVGANKLVDNSHAGGIIAAIDMNSGRLGPATDVGLRPDIGWRTHHPDTGALVEGRLVPFWPETIGIACRAHAAFAPRVIVGWDIAITALGPVLIEGNGSPGIDLIQRAYREPMGNSRAGELIRYHLSRNAETMALIGDDA